MSPPVRERPGAWWPPRRTDVPVAVLLALLGFGAVVQVRSVQEEGPLATARQGDLVQILDDLDNRNDRLRAEISRLEATRQELTSGTDRSAAALADARRRTQLLGVLAGTRPATGPGLRLTLTDPQSRLGPDVLLDALQELRAAGAEAVQIDGGPDGASPGGRESVRVVASTSFSGAPGGVVIDGRRLRPPFRFSVIGDPGTLGRAVGIPGGVTDVVGSRGGEVLLVRADAARPVRITALRALEAPRYARPR